MRLNFLRPKPLDPSDTIYLEIVRKARQTAFYRDFCVPDTVEGRFEMIVLHLALVFHRLRDEDDAAKKTAQKVVDTFFTDMDRSLREMGIGDISVPKKMKKLGQAYNGRSMAYYKAMDAGDADGFRGAVLRNVMALETGTETPEQRRGADAIAAYALATVALLKQSSVAEILAGGIATAPLGSTEAAVAPALTTGETE